MQVLLCCDDSTFISRLKTELCEQGHTVLHFEHTETVHLPDGPLLIILDSDDAQGDVLAAIRHRKNQRPDQPPIRTILLISQGAPINIEEGVDAGCDDFLLRPFTPIELSVRIKFNLHLLEKQSQPGLSDKNLVFENAPVSLRQEDFSALKKRIEQLRAEGIEDFRRHFRTHPEVVAECATLVKVLNVNRKSLELHRANSKAELLVGLANTFTEESFAVFREELIGLTEGKKHFRSEAVVKTLDGEKRDVIVQFFVEPDSRDWSQVYLALTDITEQKKSEDTLQSSESRLRSILRVAPTGIALVIDRVLQASNQKLCEIVGYSREELIGRPVSMFYRTNEDYESVSREQYRQIDLYGTGTIETRWQCKDGTIINVLLCSTPLNATDISEGVTCTILDMTARKRAERALRDSEENLRTILHSIGDAVIATDTQQCVIKLNPIAEQLTGWDASEATGRNLKEVFNIINAETGLQAEDIVGKALTSGKIVRLSNQAILRSKEGKQYPIADSAAPIKDAGGNTNGAVLVFRDMTEELRTREELQRMQTLESIGILAGGIAHDFNNILMGLFGNIAMAKRKLSPDHPSYKNLQNAENSADRAKNLTGKLLTFAKGGEPIRDYVSLADLVKEVVGFDLTGSNVKLIFEYPEDLWAADVDKGQIQQVFSNLTTNANQAMPEGGALQISLQNLHNTDHLIQGLATGKYIKAVVKDSGSGIDKNDLGRIFDPYFSTKQAGNGLGLATVYSIIHKHNGQISVTSEPGKGTTFTLLLPAKDSAAPLQKTAEVETTLPLFTTARILVMDDESAIRDLVTEMLKNIGYSVVTTCNCHEAIAAYRQAREKGEDFDIVILDLTIPGGPGGKKAVKEILQINPEAKVIVASGYAEDPVMSRCEEYGFKGIITKPYTLEELQKVLETTMAS